MRLLGAIVMVVLMAITLSAANLPTSSSTSVAFTKNMGQWPDSILFRADVGGCTMWFARDGIYYQYSRRIVRPETGRLDNESLPKEFDTEPDAVEATTIRAEFVGSNSDVEVIGLEELDYKCNYFLGNDPSTWRTDVPNYRAIALRGLYPGVDVEFRAEGSRLQNAVSAADTCDIAQLRLTYHGASVSNQVDGSVVLQTPFGPKTFHGAMPVDEVSGSAGRVPATILTSGGVTLAYSTYLGGSEEDVCGGLAVDGNGNAYLAGRTASQDFPTQNPYSIVVANGDVFVTKLSADGNSIVFSTYLGGIWEDYAAGIAVDGYGNVYVTGLTHSADFPIQNPFQSGPPIPDPTPFEVSYGFVTKVSAAGNSLVYSTYLRGSQNETSCRGIVVDNLGQAYVTGYTSASDFPTQNPYQANHAGPPYDAFLTKFSATGNSLVYSTYIGGGGEDIARAVTLGAADNVFITGYTYSRDFPTQNPYQSYQGFADGFVARLSGGGSALISSTFLGGTGADFCNDIAVDVSGALYVTGYTSSGDFPLMFPYRSGYDGASDAFVTKLSPSGNALMYSTYLGGNALEVAYGIAVDTSGAAIVVGSTGSSDFPTLHPYQTDQPIGDCFISKLSPLGNRLQYSTYIGGSSRESGVEVVIDSMGAFFVAGGTLSSDFPVLNHFQTNQGGDDIFVTKLLPPPPCCVSDTKLRGDCSNGGGAFPAGDGITDGSDLQTCIEFVFFNDAGTLVDCLETQDVNDDLLFDGGDLQILVDYIFFNDTGVIKRCDGSPF